ncbi:MAG: OB-fold nucleic acid binding domain-containing protein [Bifidobacteriaceae bacterium]|jgi:hypothetical protein|nr:OB-fold nucleic acid binding domain-containing protein [Bifidobacteriaceae bacterium]
MGAWRRATDWLKQQMAPAAALDADQELRLASVAGATPIALVPDREPVKVTGVIKSIAIGPRGSGARFEVELVDSTGSLRVVWVGQRQILGLEPGRQLVCEGRVSLDGPRLVMRDARYELLPVGSL